MYTVTCQCSKVLLLWIFFGANERPGFVWVTVSLSNRVLPIGIIGFALLETQNNWIADFQCMCMRERACVYAWKCVCMCVCVYTCVFVFSMCDVRIFSIAHIFSHICNWTRTWHLYLLYIYSYLYIYICILGSVVYIYDDARREEQSNTSDFEKAIPLQRSFIRMRAPGENTLSMQLYFSSGLDSKGASAASNQKRYAYVCAPTHTHPDSYTYNTNYLCMTVLLNDMSCHRCVITHVYHDLSLYHIFM